MHAAKGLCQKGLVMDGWIAPVREQHADKDASLRGDSAMQRSNHYLRTVLILTDHSLPDGRQAQHDGVLLFLFIIEEIRNPKIHLELQFDLAS
jgi:hypothetical protein